MKHVYKDGTIEYYNKKGQLHKTDGPAMILPSGIKAWHINGNLHRTDGPAMILPDGQIAWYINDKAMTFNEWTKHTTLSDKELTLLQLKYEAVT